MADRVTYVKKKPLEVLEDLMAEHREETIRGPRFAKKYLITFLEKYNSIPNAVKFFIYDLLSEDAWADNDTPLCREAIEKAEYYFENAKEEFPLRVRDYKSEIRFFERGISLSSDEGNYEEAVRYCELALETGLGKEYESKLNSFRRLT